MEWRGNRGREGLRRIENAERRGGVVVTTEWQRDTNIGEMTE